MDYDLCMLDRNIVRLLFTFYVFKFFFFFFLLMENLGAMAYSRYTGFREITDCNVLELL